MTIQIFSSAQLSNEDYHLNTTHVSGTTLHKLFTTCPASVRYGVETDDDGNIIDKKSRALEFGSCAHTNFLEQSKFDEEYMRGTTKEDEFSGELIITKTACEGWLRSRGIKGFSGKAYHELISMIRSAQKPGEEVFILAEIEEKESKLADQSCRKLIRGDDFDACMKMREVLYQNGGIRDIMELGEPEVSVFAVIDDVPVKVRFDYIYDWRIIDYKTTASANPQEFARQCYNAGYYLKMALQHDVFEIAYGQKPKEVKLLAQEKKNPFIPAMYRIQEEQLAIGRLQYRSALQTWRACVEKDVWPAYGGGAELELQTPAFVKNQYKDFIK